MVALVYWVIESLTEAQRSQRKSFLCKYRNTQAHGLWREFPSKDDKGKSWGDVKHIMMTIWVASEYVSITVSGEYNHFKLFISYVKSIDTCKFHDILKYRLKLTRQQVLRYD